MRAKRGGAAAAEGVRKRLPFALEGASPGGENLKPGACAQRPGWRRAQGLEPDLPILNRPRRCNMGSESASIQ